MGIEKDDREKDNIGPCSNLEMLARYIGVKNNPSIITQMLCYSAAKISVEKIHKTDTKS